MPWTETQIVDERVRFIAAVTADPRGNFSRLCEQFGIRRQTGYKWLERYRELGATGLEDQRPVARSCPHKTPDAVVDRLINLRKQHPFDGPKKLRARLSDDGLSSPADQCRDALGLCSQAPGLCLGSCLASLGQCQRGTRFASSKTRFASRMDPVSVRAFSDYVHGGPGL